MPTRSFPIVTILLVLINVVVFVYQMLILGAGGDRALNQFIMLHGVVPLRVETAPGPATWWTFITSMFMHGGWLHIGGNMLYLWIFGNNVEDVLGKFWYLLFYLAAGIVASLAQVVMSPGSAVPGIGASGAIAGVLAAYLLFFPGARVDTLIFLGYFFTVRALPAVLVLGIWFVLQLFNGLASIGSVQGGGVAYYAHIGGFVSGLILALPWLGYARRLRAGRAL
jgi:membrane associated rhomboid family serine protease